MDIAKSSANILTLTRIVVSPLAFLLILNYDDELGASWYLFALAIFVVASDLFDGRLARYYKTTSNWGTLLDPLADKIIVLGCAFCFVFVDRYWILPVLLLFVREVPIAILRFYYMFKSISIPASFLAKWKTTLQGLALAAAAFPPFKTYSELHLAFIWAAVVVTFYTGLQYVLAPKTASSSPKN